VAHFRANPPHRVGDAFYGRDKVRALLHAHHGAIAAFPQWLALDWLMEQIHLGLLPVTNAYDARDVLVALTQQVAAQTQARQPAQAA
jgi:hypothetical protein